MTKLVLFDVDRTLVKVVTFKRFFPLVIKEMTGKDINLDEKFLKTLSGRTDRDISTRLLRYCGFTEKEIEEKLDLVFERFIKTVDKKLEKDLRKNILPGVKELLDKLKKEDVILGIVTGNSIETARIKLERTGLWDYFQVGGFGWNTLVRSDIVKEAVEKAEKKFGIKFFGKDIVIIGDTPYDIECGKPLGAKTIVVATGPYTLEELKKHDPDYVLNDLTETEKIIKTIKG